APRQRAGSGGVGRKHGGGGAESDGGEQETAKTHGRNVKVSYILHKRRALPISREQLHNARMTTAAAALEAVGVGISLGGVRVASARHRPRGSGALSTLLGRTAVAEAAADEKAHAVIEAFGLTAYADKGIGELSTGTRRVVDLAGILIQRPSVVLLDEPSSGI